MNGSKSKIRWNFRVGIYFYNCNIVQQIETTQLRYNLHSTPNRRRSLCIVSQFLCCSNKILNITWPIRYRIVIERIPRNWYAIVLSLLLRVKKINVYSVGFIYLFILIITLLLLLICYHGIICDPTSILFVCQHRTDWRVRISHGTRKSNDYQTVIK